MKAISEVKRDFQLKGGTNLYEFILNWIKETRHHNIELEDLHIFFLHLPKEVTFRVRYNYTTTTGRINLPLDVKEQTLLDMIAQKAKKKTKTQ